MQHGFSLRRIRISHNDQITDIGISAVGRSCPLVNEIDFSHCGMISGRGQPSPRADTPISVIVLLYAKLIMLSKGQPCIRADTSISVNIIMTMNQ